MGQPLSCKKSSPWMRPRLVFPLEPPVNYSRIVGEPETISKRGSGRSPAAGSDR